MVLLPLERDESRSETIQLLTQNPCLQKERKKMEKGDHISFEDFRKKYMDSRMKYRWTQKKKLD